MAPLLDVQNLVKHFPISGSSKVVQALNGVSFTIDKGETLSLVGESGSGKTTVGRCVVGLVPATDGAILFDGEPLDARRNIRHRSVRGRIQFVFQEPNESLDPRIPVGVSLAEPLRHLGVARADRERRVLDVAGRIGVTEADLLRYPGELAGGILQRIGIGRAIVTRPDLIVLDEPTSALDPTSRAEIVDLLIRLQKELGTAYLFISHDLSTVRFVSHKLAVLYLGSVAEAGEAARIFAAPRHPYSVGLLASVLLPHPSLKPRKRLSLEGEIPSPVDLPPGCPLASRCPFAEERCRSARPAGVTPVRGQLVHCINHEKVAALGEDTDNFARFQDIAARVLSGGIETQETFA